MKYIAAKKLDKYFNLLYFISKRNSERGFVYDIKRIQRKKGFSQTELGNRVGLKQTTISQYENGSRKPNLTVAKKLADALEMTLDDFICLSTFQNET